jgi:hypothetical protein
LTSKEVQANWTELATISYTGSSLTHVSHIFDQHGQLCLLTAAGDGCLAVWSTELELMPDVAQKIETVREFETPVEWTVKKLPSMKLLQIYKVHQSAIKFCHVLPFKELCIQPSYLIVSAGDDNGIGITFIQFPKPNTKVDAQIETLLIPNAHTGSVVSIQAFWEIDYKDKSQSAKFPIRIISLGADQRVKLWSIELELINDKPQWKVKRLSDQYSAVADPGCLKVFNAVDDNYKVLGTIVGVGLEHWDFGAGHVPKFWEPNADFFGGAKK